MGGRSRPSLLFAQAPHGMNFRKTAGVAHSTAAVSSDFYVMCLKEMRICSLTHHFSQNSQSKASFWVSEPTFSFFTPNRDTKVSAKYAARQIWRLTSSSHSGISETRARHSFLWANCSIFFVRFTPAWAICAYRSNRTLAVSSALRELQPETRNGPHAPGAESLHGPTG